MKYAGPLSIFVNRILVNLCGGAFLVLSIVIFVEIISRKLFGFSLQGADELGGYIVAITGAFGFYLGLLDRGHTRVDFVTERLPVRARAWLNVLAYATTAVAAICIAYWAWLSLNETLMFDSHSTTPMRTPLWIPQSLWLFGLIVFAVGSVVLTVRSAILATRDPELQDRLYGTIPGAEEAQAEIAPQVPGVH